MTTKHLKLLLNWFWIYSKKNKTSGFTLIELLVGLVIASLVILALLTLVIDILQVDRREAARDETQREMQMALDYMATELREAVYVYDNNCITTGQGTAPSSTATASVNYCPGLANHLPTSLISATQIPVLAFWKPETIDDADLTALGNCSTITAAKQQDCKDLLVKRRTYTLVVYLQTTTSSNNWPGKSRIIRYALRKYDNLATLTENSGYVDPSIPDSTSFQMWPKKIIGEDVLQTSLPSANNTAVLVDFVDEPNSTTPGTIPSCDTATGYIRSPAGSGTPSTTNNSFFACVKSVVSAVAQSGTNQDVILYLRGNAYGKSGVKSDSFRPVLQTQVLIRGVINKIPQ